MRKAAKRKRQEAKPRWPKSPRLVAKKRRKIEPRSWTEDELAAYLQEVSEPRLSPAATITTTTTIATSQATSGPHLTTAYHATPHRATLQRAGLSKSEATKITAGGGGGNQAFLNPPHRMPLVMSESNKKLLGIDDEVFLESQIDRLTLRALHQRSAMEPDKVRAVRDAAQELRDPLLPKSVLALLAIPTPRFFAGQARNPSFHRRQCRSPPPCPSQTTPRRAPATSPCRLPPHCDPTDAAADA